MIKSLGRVDLLILSFFLFLKIYGQLDVLSTYSYYCNEKLLFMASVSSSRSPEELLNKNTVIALLNRELPIIKERFGVIKIGLFGSYARDEAVSGSDIDILVTFEEGKERFRPYMQCIYYLESVLGKPVEMISDHSLDPKIRTFIEKEVIWI